MIAYKFNLSIAGKERPLVIYADHKVITEENELQFYDAADNLIATVSAEIIIAFTES